MNENAPHGSVPSVDPVSPSPSTTPEQDDTRPTVAQPILPVDVDTATFIPPATDATDPADTIEATRSGTNPADEVSIPGYEVRGVLGRGGMGVVYQARHVALKRDVALKMMLAGRHAGPVELARFRIEAEAIARLQHPNIVQIHEVGEADGHPYCALEFVSGQSLDRKLKPQPLAPREAAELIETLARAMQFAHSRNVVHRDLKPANILLTVDGNPKITDFGLARQLDHDSGATQADAVMGTPSYMAPEQASGNTHAAGPAADVYALGAIFYECLTGRPPFKGTTILETLDQVRHQEPVNPSHLRSSVPLDLETVCLKCLRKEPENRYASAAELADDLRRFLRGEPVEARPVGSLERSWRWCQRNPLIATLWAGVALSLLLGIVGSSYFAWQEGRRALSERIARINEQDQRREADHQRGLADVAAESARKAATAAKNAAELAEEQRAEAVIARNDADHQRSVAEARFTAATLSLAQSAWESHDAPLYRQQLERLVPGEVIPGDRRGFEWHYLRQLDDQSLATLHGHTSPVVCLIPRDGGDLLSVDQGGIARIWPGGHAANSRIAWKNPDPISRCLAARGGNRLVVVSNVLEKANDRYVTRGKIRVVDAEEGDPVFSTELGEAAVGAVAISEDGEWLALTATDSEPKPDVPARIRIWHIAAGETFSSAPDAPRVPVENSAEQTSKDPLASRDANTVGSEEALAISLAAGMSPSALAFTADGESLMIAEQSALSPFGGPATNPRLFAWNLAERKEQWSQATTGSLASLYLSPDGSTIVAAQSSGEIQMFARSSGVLLRELLGHQAQVMDLAYSADGGQIASVSADNTVRIWEAVSGRPLGVLMGHRDLPLAIAFERLDGSPTLVSAGNERVIKRWPRNRAGRTFRALEGAGEGVRAIALSTEGSLLAAVASDGRVRLWDLSLPGNSPIQVLEGHALPVTAIATSPDGRLLASAEGQPLQPSKVIVRDLPSGETRYELAGFTTTVRALAFSPDGSVLVTGDGNAPTFGEVIYWNAETGRRLRIVPGEINEIHALSFSPDGRQLAISGGWGDQMGRLRLWNSETAEVLQDLRGFGQQVNRVVFTPDSQQIAATSGLYLGGGEIKFWRTADGSERATLLAHQGPIHALAISPDGERLVSAGSDQTIRIWDVKEAELLLALRGHKKPIFAARFSADGTRLVTAADQEFLGGPSELFVWDASPTPERLTLRPDFGSQFKTVDSNLRGPADIYALQSNNVLRSWDPKTGVSQFKWSIPGELTQAFAVAPDGSQVVTVGVGGMSWFDPRTRQEIERVSFGATEVSTAVRFSPDGNSVAIAVGELFQKIRLIIYDTQTRKTKATIATDFLFLAQLSWSPDGQTLAVVGGSDFSNASGRLLLFNPQDGHLQRELKSPYSQITELAFSPNSESIAVSETGQLFGLVPSRQSVTVLRIETGDVVAKCDGPSQGLVRIAFSADGQSVITVGTSEGVMSWKATTGELERTTDIAVSRIQDAILFEDSNSLAVKTPDGSMEFWDLATARPRNRAQNWPRDLPKARAETSGELLAARVARLPAPPPSQNSVADAMRQASIAFRRTEASKRMKEIALAFHNYAQVYQGIPQVAITSNEGRPLLSWRVALLPFLGERELYQQFHLDEPWDSPHNKPLLSEIPKAYAPVAIGPAEAGPRRVGGDVADVESPVSGLTHIRVVTGKQTMFPQGRKEAPLTLTPKDVPNGVNETLLFLENAAAIEWTRPEELAWDDTPGKESPDWKGSIDSRGFFGAFVNGSVRFVSFDEFTPPQIRRMIRRE